MLRALGNPRRLCDGLSRRDWLHIGGCGIAGLSLEQLLATRASAASSAHPSFGRAKQCIVLFLYGSPSQLETFDCKPEAPVEVRGTFGSIPSSLPGLDVCDLLPQMAKVMDRTTVVRSVTHPHPIHGVAWAMTGTATIDVGMELNPREERHHPYFASCVQYLDQRAGRATPPGVLPNIALPFPFSSKRSDQPFRAGPYPSFLGGAYAPVWTEFVGEGTQVIRKERDNGKYWFEGPEPYLGCTRDSHFRLAAVERPQELVLDRLDRRRELLAQFEDVRRELDRTAAGSALSAQQAQAWSLLSSPQVHEALDVRKEHEAIRQRYGHSLFGQSCLAARRLVEAGTRVVSVFWDEYGLAGDAWDTHFDHFNRMQNQLCPSFDQAMYGLITDLEDRGLLDETLVVLISEHGRTPKVNNAAGGGRDHWSRAYSVVFAGGGTPRGSVIGATDSIAGDVIERPISPKSLLATMYHLLGISPHQELRDSAGRATPLLPEDAVVVPELLA